MLTLTFSETVNATSLDITSITFLSNSTQPETMYTLVDSIGQLEDAVILVVTLGEMDTNLLKYRTGLASDRENTFVRLNIDAVLDMNNNPYVNDTTVIQVDVLMADQTQPRIRSFNLDIDTGVLSLTFTEVINGSTLNITAITLQNHPSTPTSNFMLNGGILSGSNVFPGHPPVVDINLLFEDLNSIKRLTLLATDNTTTFLSIAPDAALDLAPVPNTLAGIGSTTALPVDMFIEDLTPPELVDFDIDLTAEQLLLVFNETVDRDSLNVTQITLHSSADLLTSSENYTLQASTVISLQNDIEILLSLNPADLNFIKLRPTLCTDASNCYISFTSDTIVDMNGNQVVEIPSDAGQLVRNFTEDVTSPMLLVFGLDMDSGVVTLLFSEPVNVSSLNISGLLLQSYNGASEPNTVHTFTPGEYPEFTDTQSPNGLAIMLRLGTTDLYDIQRKRTLATETANTYISIELGAVLDMNGLQVVAIEPNNSLQVDSTLFVGDNMPPRILEFLLNVDEGLLSLTFDETVDSSSLMPGRLTLLSTNDTTTLPELRLSDVSIVQNFDDPIINITLTKPDLDQLKLYEDLGTLTENTYLHLMFDAVRDNARLPSGNAIQPVTIQASQLLSDVTPPMLTSFEIDLNTGLLILNFDEPVNASSINFESITLQNAQDADNVTSSYTLSNGTVFSMNGLSITINITTEDLNEIKVRDELAVSLNTSYIRVTRNVAADMAGNLLALPPVPLQVDTITLDTSSPTLIVFGLDMNNGTIRLEFNEPVNISTINFTEITLQQDPTGIVLYVLTGGMLLSVENDEVVQFQLLENDLNELKRLQIGSSQVTSYITFTSEMILDVAGNQVVPVTGRGAADYITDFTPPELIQFDLNLTSETLDLEFSETVRAMSLDITYITLQNAQTMPSHTLTRVSSTNSSDGTLITVNLGRDDLNVIKLLTNLATSEDDTYLSYASATIEDMFGNNVVNRSELMPLQVTNFTGDSIPPELEAFTLDLTNETLTLSFSESVNSSTFDPSAITIQGSQTLAAGTSFVTLTDGITGDNNFILEVMLLTADLNELKRLLDLATSRSNTFISITSDLIRDMNGNAVVSIMNNTALMVTELLEDRVPPRLEDFSLNMNTSELILSFSETVSASTLNVQAIILQDDENSTNYYQLSAGEVQPENSPVIVVEISERDTNLIKEIFTLATGINNTFLRLQEAAVEDMNQNSLEEIENGLALQAGEFVPDSLRPELLNFTFDLNMGQLLLYFSETVNVQSVNFTAITLQNGSSTNETIFYILTGGDMSLRNFTDVAITLLPDDFNIIKSLLTLGTSVSDTYLSITRYLLEDMNANQVIDISEENALQAYNVILDFTSPQLVSFNLNLTSDVLSLSFSETVSANSFNQSAITIYDSIAGPVSYTLVDSYVTPLVDATEIFVQISRRDANEIKRLPLATSADDTYLVIDSPTIADTSGNLVQRIPPEEALNVSIYTEDTLNPVLESFNFNVSSGEITLTFSETVNATSLQVAGFTLQAVTNASFLVEGEGLYQLTLESTSSQSNSHILVITVQGDDLNLIKRDTTLAISNQTTYISIQFRVVLDMNGNPVEEISPEFSLPVATYIEDTVPPELLAFNLYLTPGTSDLILELIFSETVNASSIQPTGFIFSNTGSETNTTQTFRLTGGEVSQNDSTVITIAIPEADLEDIRLLDASMLLTLPETSFLAVDPNTVLDMADNAIVPILLTSTLNISGSFADLNPPRLDSFVLDLDTGTLFFQFTEDVLSTTVIPTYLSLHSGANVGFNETLGSFITLTNATNISTIPSPGSLLVFNIVAEDLNEIKRLTGLAISRRTTYLSFRRGFVLDTSQNEAVVIPEDSAERARMYIRDSSGPELVSFDVDLTNEMAIFTFSETINATSVDVTQFQFQNSISSANRFYSLTTSKVVSNDSTVLVIQFSEQDSNGIKAVDGLLTSRSDSFIAVDREALRDLGRNELIDVSPNNALQVFRYTEDTIRPRLLNFTIDLDEGFIILTFDETVREPTLDARQLTLLDATNGSEYNLTLTNGISNLNIGTIVNISFSLFDLNELKRLPLCTSQYDCYLSFTQDLILDMVALSVVEILPNMAVLPAEFIPDTTGPSLVQFAVIDFDRELIVLEFSETVNVETLQLSDITLQSLFTNPIATIRLTGGSVPAENTSILVISFDQADLDSLKLAQYVCTYRGNCYINFTSALVEDMSSNPAVAVTDDFPGFISVNFISDTIQPEVVAFDLDLELGILLLELSEPLDTESIVLSEIVLQGAQNASNDMQFPLSGGTVTVISTRLYQIQLSPEDVEGIKSSQYFKSVNSTFLSISSSAASDVAFYPKSILAIPSDNATQVRNFTADLDGPLLLFFTLDYTSNQLLLTFNEPVLPTSFNFSGISFSATPDGNDSYTLTGGRVSNVVDPSVGLMEVVVELTQADTTALKASLTLATSASNTYISLANATVFNTFGEANMAVDGMRANQVTVDTSELQIDSFFLDMNEGLLTLSFTDVVRSATFDARGVIIQNAEDAQDQFRYQLTQDSVNLSPDGYRLLIQIGESDLNSIKSIPNLATNENDTFLTMRASAVEDVFGNDILAVTNGKGRQVAVYTPDTTPPTLLNYTLDANTGSITLTFSEAVSPSTLNISLLQLQDNSTDSTELLSLNSSSPFQALSLTEIQVTLVESDLNLLKQLTQLGTDETNTFLFINSGAIEDFVGNMINDTTAFPVGTLLPDVTNPRLLSYVLDLNTGTLLLAFSETVNGSSLNVSKITFQGTEIFRQGVVYSLTNSMPEEANAVVIMVNISLDDLNALKQLPGLA